VPRPRDRGFVETEGDRAMGAGCFSIFAVWMTLLLILCGVAALPALLVIGAVALAFSLLAGVIGIALRVIGALLLCVLALPLAVGMFGVAIAVAVALLHAALPLLVVIGIVWLIAHQRRPVAVAPRV
jgi:hypothetical protein